MSSDAGTRAVRESLAAHGLAATTVRPLGSGLDHTAYEVDGELVVRFVSDPHDPADVAREARLLTVVADVVPLPMPVPLVADPGRSCLIYRKLPGLAVLDLGDVGPHARRLGAELGRFMAALYTLPAGDLAGVVPLDDTPLAAWSAEARRLFDDVRSWVPPEHRPAVADFLAGAPPPAPRRHVLAHNDLGTEHIIVDPTDLRITGIIDWGDAAVTDPARDLGLVLRDLGPDALEAALRTYDAPADAGLVERARFYARCCALEDLAYGLETGRDAYATKTLRSLGCLFPARRPH